MAFPPARFATLWEVFENPKLRRLELAVAGFHLDDWAHFVALSVFAYQRGGATAVGIFGLVRMAAAAVAVPFGSVLADRYPRQRVLLVVYAGRTAALAATAAVLAEGSPTAVVFALAALASLFGGPFRPAHLALLPVLARTPQQLVAANVASSTFEGGAVLLGPALAGALLAVTTAAVVVGVSAGVSLWSGLLVLGVGREESWTRRRRPPGWTPLGETLAGLRTLREDPRPRLVTGLFAAQTFVRGLLNVLLVATALQVLHTGQSGVGFLNAAIGAGGIVGAAATVRLVGRRRLAAPFAVGLVLWGAPIAAAAAWSDLGWALLCLGVIGVGNALLDVSGYTLIQRTVDDAVLGRVFGVFEIVVSAAIAAGSIVAPLLLHGLGVRRSLVVAGVILPVLALACRPRLRAIDGSVTVPEAEVELLRSIPLFRPLPVTLLERLASHLRPLTAAAGADIVVEGAAGDRFYVIGAGEVSVLRDDREVARLKRGEYFGEIALLHDIPRVATCRAATEVELLGLERDVFVAAVTGHAVSESTVDGVMSGRLAELEQLAAPRQGPPYPVP